MSSPYVIVAAGGSQTQKEESFLTSRIGLDSGISEVAPMSFAVPDGDSALKFGSFDALVRLTEDLQKYDSQVEGVLRRIERQYLDLDENAPFEVLSNRTKKTLEGYLRSWQWDDAKFPRNRSLQDNLQFLLTVVNKLDEESRTKGAAFNEVKTLKNNVSKKEEGQSLMTRDLIDLLTPEAVKAGSSPNDDLVYTDYLTTVLVILGKGGEEEFLKDYENLSEMVVPATAKRFAALDDKEGNSIWRVVVFKNAAENFKRACRDKRYTVRDFEYNDEACKKMKAQRATLDKDYAAQAKVMRAFCSAAWSDVMVAFVHVKAMRVFVDCALRFGVPASFSAYFIQPKPAAVPQMRKALAQIFGGEGNAIEQMAKEAGEGETEEFYPYVSINFSPFAPKAA